MPRKRSHEEHANHEAWAIPYGDLVTLLLAFFVVMYALSSVNEGKFRVLSDSLNAAFRGTPRSMEPVQVGQAKVGSGSDIEMTLVQDKTLAGQPRQLLESVPLNATGDVQNGVDRGGRGAGDPDSASAQDQLQQIADSVQASVASLVESGLVNVKKTGIGVEVEIKADILFASGSATLSPTAVDVIARLADVLRDYPNAVRVEGHTDNLPIKSAIFPSNWELSAARAASVVQVLDTSGVQPSRLEVLGVAEHRPIGDNATAIGRNTNRRVVIVILKPPVATAASPKANEPPSASLAGSQ